MRISFAIATFVVAALVGQVHLAAHVDRFAVRSLKFEPKDRRFRLTLSAQNKLTRFEKFEDIEKLVGKKLANEIVESVDFRFEAIVLVSWMTEATGGSLKHEAKISVAERKLIFFVHGPPNPMDGSLVVVTIGADFFAVPKTVSVAFEKQRP